MAGYTDQYTEDTTVDPKLTPTYPGDPDWDDNDNGGKVIPDNVPADTGLKWAFIGIGIAGIVLLIVTLVCCMRSKQRAKSYEYKTYATNKEEVEKLDNSLDYSGAQHEINR